MEINIQTLLTDTTLADDMLVDINLARQALGPPGKPVSTKFIGREKKRPNGLEFVSIGGRDLFTVGGLRNVVRSRMRRPNPRREGRQNART